MKKYFSEVSIGGKFHYNGNNCTKKSQRTAWIDAECKLWFYFGMRERITMGWK